MECGHVRAEFEKVLKRNVSHTSQIDIDRYLRFILSRFVIRKINLNIKI